MWHQLLASSAVGLDSVHNSSLLLLFTPHRFPLLQNELSISCSHSGMSTDSSVGPPGVARDLEHLLPFFSGLGICRAVSHVFLAPLSQILCSIFDHLKYVTREEPAVLLMGSAVPCSRSPVPGMGQPWAVLTEATPAAPHCQHLGSQYGKQHRAGLGCTGNDLHMPGASSAQGARNMSGPHLLMWSEF